MHHKKFAVLYFSVLGLIGAAFIARTLHADAIPSRMEPVDAARLQASMAELQRIDSEAKSASAPHRARAQEILARYHIDPATLGKTVAVNFDTGEIARKEAATPRISSPRVPDGGAK